MASKSWASLVFTAGLFLIQPAIAEPALESEAIVRHFIGSADLGAARGICIGTQQECSADRPAPAGFDMLINFELDSADLTSGARQTLGQFAVALKDPRLSSARFVVEGHTDARGSERYNVSLSERRAQAVTAYLLEQGVSRDKVEALGVGKSAPRTADPFDPVNRRVEMRISLQ